MRMITDFVVRDTTLGKQFPLKLNNTVSNIEKFTHFYETKANTSIKKFWNLSLKLRILNIFNKILEKLIHIR